MTEHINCASCSKQMPLEDFGLKAKPKCNVRYLCLACYSDAVTEAQATFNELFAAESPGFSQPEPKSQQ